MILYINKKAGRLNDELAKNYCPWWPLTFVRCANIMQQIRPMPPICVPSFIHIFTMVAEKSAFFGKNPNFCTNYGPLMSFDLCERSSIYIHFWTAHITYYHSAKFQVSVINSVWEKSNVNGLFCNDYCPLWPLTFARGNQTMHFWKTLITYYHHNKFQYSVMNSLWEKFER